MFSTKLCGGPLGAPRDAAGLDRRRWDFNSAGKDTPGQELFRSCSAKAVRLPERAHAVMVRADPPT
jgi:hypothetical protein